MSDFNKGGIWDFLPYGLPVLGGAIGMFWARYGTDHFNPVFAVAGGVIAGIFLAKGVTHLADRFGWRK